MAVSASSYLMPSLKSDRTTRLTAVSSSSSSSSSSTLSFSSSLQFPLQLRRLRIASKGVSAPPSRARVLPMVTAKQQTFSSFDDLLTNSDKPVLVDFYATWCGPCQFMVPILTEVGTALKDKIQVVKIDTEKYPRIADKYKIEALPTFIIFKDGEPFDRFEGAMPAEQLIQRIEDTLKIKQ